MVAKLFASRPPSAEDVVLDPGCGRGEFIAGVLRWCEARRVPAPTIVGVENDPHHWAPAHSRFLGDKRVKIRRRDFLKPDSAKYDYVVGNPPYVPITELSQEERDRYRDAGFATASGRMDLYMLFFEAALSRLAEKGRLVFVTPEKFLYVDTATPLRKLLSAMEVEEIELLPEDTFPGLTTYPAITTVNRQRPKARSRFLLRDGSKIKGELPADGSSWLPHVRGYGADNGGPILEAVALRLSPGIATGADGVFILRNGDIHAQLAPFAYPTIAGRDLRQGAALPRASASMLVPYAEDGRLRAPRELGKLLSYLGQPERKARLMARTCASRKSWYSFHDSAPLGVILRPKILWKDISAKPAFWVDHSGGFVPRHSVYYLVPKHPARIDDIAAYLASKDAKDWIEANCQRAANGFLRLQSEVLKRLPIPSSLLGRGADIGPGIEMDRAAPPGA